MIIAVLTAVPTEYEIMRNLFAREKTGEIQEKFDGAFFHEIIPISINNTSINIILGMSDQGNVEASIAVNHILRECKPDLFFFAGTCSGIKDVSIGDSIIVTEVFDLLRGNAGDTWRSIPASGKMAAEKRGICISMMMEINRGEVLPEYYFNIGNKLYMGAIGSSSAIVASEHTKIREIIKNQYANIIAVEMEGYGFYQTLERNGYRSGVMIRAVTDDAKSKTQDADDIIQPGGMKKVYHVVYEFIRKYVTSTVPALPQSILDKKDTLHKLINQYSDGTSTDLPENPVFAGFLSFDLESRSTNLFHLGHAYFVKFVDALLDLKQKTVIYICSSNSNINDMSDEKYLRYRDILDDIILKWEKCFNNQVEIIDVGEKLRTIQYSADSWEKRAAEYLRRVEGKFTEFFNNREKYISLLTSMTNWRINGAKNDDYTSTLEAALEIHPSDVKDDNGITIDEIYAISYVLLKKPRWYSSDWFISFIAFFGETMNRADQMQNLVIIESRRNAYSWLGMSFLAKKMNRRFPPMLFFKTVPDIKNQKYMNTDTRDLCITLDNYLDINKLDTDPLFINEMSNLLSVDKADVCTEIIRVMGECKKRIE